MTKHTAYLSRIIAMSVLLILLLAPVSVRAEPLGNHIGVWLVTTPDRPVAGDDTRLTINLKDASQQPTISASVSIMAEKATSLSAGSHVGSNHSTSTSTDASTGAMLHATAKAGANKGEYVASLKLPEEGQWRIIVTAGDTTTVFNVNAGKPQANSRTNTATSPSVAPAGQGAEAPVAPMEAIHASYLDLSANISDLRSRIEQWHEGDESSLPIAQEKLDRTVAILNSVVWPREMVAAIGKTRAGIDPLARALKAKDVNAADAAAKAIGDAYHDVTHTYYGDWMPGAQHGSAADQLGGIHDSGTSAGLADSHGHEGESGLPNYWFAGTVVGIVLVTIALVPILRRRELSAQRVEAY